MTKRPSKNLACPFLPLDDLFVLSSFCHRLTEREGGREGGGYAQMRALQGSFRNQHCLTRSDVTSVERGVRMSQCGEAPLGMRIEGVGDSRFS